MNTSTNDFMASYFGPLPKKYCLYFFWLSVIFFCLMIFSIVSTVTFAIMNPKKITTQLIINAILLWLNMGIAYMSNRLLNTMCLNSTSHY